jgi:hypothetical protein
MLGRKSEERHLFVQLSIHLSVCRAVCAGPAAGVTTTEFLFWVRQRARASSMIRMTNRGNDGDGGKDKARGSLDRSQDTVQTSAGRVAAGCRAGVSGWGRRVGPSMHSSILVGAGLNPAPLSCEVVTCLLTSASCCYSTDGGGVGTGQGWLSLRVVVKKCLEQALRGCPIRCWPWWPPPSWPQCHSHRGLRGPDPSHSVS